MLSRKLFQVLLAVGGAASSPFTKRATVTTAEFLGNITSTNTENIRDLGFAGRVGDVYLNSYGDTLTCGNGSEEDRYYQTPPCLLLSANSAAYSTDDPLQITDFNLDESNADIFCGYFEDETPESDYGMGITNVIAMPNSTTQGILYFLKNHRPNQVDDIVGGGVAVVDVSGEYPTCERISDHWWDANTEPQYGDHSQVLGQDGYIYVFGGVKSTLPYDGVYLARVPHGSQQDLEAYEYWDGSSYVKERLQNPGEVEAILGPAYASVVARTADKPEGPWSEPFTIYDVEGYAIVYSPSHHTRYDESGKTLVVTYTAYPNINQAVKVTIA